MRDMRGIILAAGKGERLKGIVDDIPKPMVKIKGRPILEHNIAFLRRFGITDLYINLHHHPAVIQNYFGDGSQHGVHLSYSYEEALLGTAGGVRRIAESYWQTDLQTEAPFVVVYGDNLLDYDLDAILRYHQTKKGIGTIAVYEKEEVSQSGIVVLNDAGQITRFIEKPKQEECISNLVNTGLYIFESKVINYIDPHCVLDFGKEVLPRIIQAGERLFGVVVKGSLIAIDTPQLLKTAIQMNPC